MPSYHSQQQALVQLPQPDAAEIQHSNRLVDFIVERINENEGPISFRQYMNLLLYAPGLGYYSAGLTKFGQAGDFVTAPEISPLFGRALANQCQKLFDQGCQAHILEFGAGSGKLCEQILTRLDKLQSYYILELSADLRERQQTYLKQVLTFDAFNRISWLDRLPNDFNGIVVANEVLDAMPVHRLRKQERWYEMGVDFDGERFCWEQYSDSSLAVSAIQDIEGKNGPYPDGYTTEVNLNYQPWLKSLSEISNQVVVLLIDYGYEQAEYYHPQRSQGTLLCHFHHRAHDDVLILPGLQDVTASVDFDAVAEAAIDNGFDAVGLVNQAQFLLENGLLDEACQNESNGDSLRQLDVAQQIKTLTLPGEMGEKFKVLGLVKNLDLDIPALKRKGMM